MKNIGRFLMTLIAAVGGMLLFKWLHLPLPWLLGPMFASLLGSNLLKVRFVWPSGLRNAGLLVVGYTIGAALTADELGKMAEQFPSMLLMTLLLMLLCAGIAWLMAKLLDMDYRTALLACIPGGLSQVLKMAEETQGVNLTMVTLNQVVRLIMIFALVPMLVFSPLVGQAQHAVGEALWFQVEAAHGVSLGLDWSALLIFAGTCIACAVVGGIIRMPTPYLLGPALGTALLQLAGLEGPVLPGIVINVAQLAIGIYVGMLLKPEQLKHGWRTLAVAIGSGLLLILGSLGLSLLLISTHPVALSTALLCLAPGGLDQMGIIAQEIDADISMVASYQLFRILFILFIVSPILQRIIRLPRRSVPSDIE
ncbi:AbrB family transcriptional regulator [Paenibacillus eucommiae]|uniref:Membrane AbrB-like protein n=1 Tax=Paenibacillus eucommiae TaxID=1355755 RepID=A0ABS4IVD8_9BACL|nr:AbrB family transcriptional regulator [Paenibacillus eucommiae]MBP1990524.1 membrane AbrB-like protein [Paenibacillus eucommiae]